MYREKEREIKEEREQEEINDERGAFLPLTSADNNHPDNKQHSSNMYPGQYAYDIETDIYTSYTHTRPPL